jgi:hypothetical protein
MASRDGRSAMREKFGNGRGIASYAKWGDVMRTSSRRRLRLVAAAAGLVLVTATPGSVAPAAANPTVTRVMSGLDNPRGLAFGPKGALYVAEAGRGGFGLVDCSIAPLPLFCFTGSGGMIRSYGPTGAISRLLKGVQERVVTGLPSQARALDGTNAIGPHDVAFLEGPDIESPYVAIGLQQPPALRDMFPYLSDMASLARIERSGGATFIADLGAYERANNPDGGPLDTNPYGLLAVPDGHVLTDAGGNSMLHVDWNGDVSTLAVFQSRPSGRSTDSVPTSVAIGPDGAYYVGELSPGVGTANVYRVVPGEPPRLFLASEACLGGFTTIIDIAFDDEGNLYVLQIGPGTLIRITPDENQPGDICDQFRAGTRTTIVGGLTAPTSVAFGHGALYVSNRGVFPGIGEVLRVDR